MSPKITLAAIRHYFRALNLKVEAKERIDEDEMDRQVHQEQEAARFRRPQRRAARCFGRRGAGKGPEYIAVRGGAARRMAACPPVADE
jgi:hypothetical protein